MILKGKCVWLNGRFMSAALFVENGKIQQVLPYENVSDGVDFGEKRVVPGFIDIHTHGAYGFDTNSADPNGLKMWQNRLPAEGVTSFLATTVTAFKGTLLQALHNIAEVKQQSTLGAELLGVHLEGPYIDEKYHGAQPIEAIVKPAVQEFEEYQKAAEGAIRLVTLAPEHDCNFALTRYCAQQGVVVSLGHSSATLEQAALAAANGAKSVTHTYNGMSAFSHRANGMVGAALRLDDLYTEAICDCNHCTPEALNLLFRTKGKDRCIMVSDSLMCKGYLPGKRFCFAGLEVEIYEDGSAHLVKEKNFAGSTMKMNEGLKNLVERALVPFEAALNSCTANPAALLGEGARIGSLTVGHDADIVLLDDDYTVLETFCKGEKAF